MEKKTLSIRLREAISRLGITDYEFARSGGISRATLSTYLNQGRIPKIDCVARWITQYNLDAHWLIIGEGDILKSDTPSCPEKFSQSLSNRYSNPMLMQIDSVLNALEAAKADNRTIQLAVTALVAQHLLNRPDPSIPLISQNEKATARFYTANAIVLCAGSAITTTIQSSISDEAFRKRSQADIDGILRKTSSGSLITIEDLTFTSVSSSAGFIKGISTNGWEFWKLTQTGQPLKKFKTYLQTTSQCA